LITDIFERQEKKYMLSSGQYASLLPYIKAHCVPDEYPESDVCSIYYDTDDMRLIRASIDKPAYKEKLRIRAYEIPGPETMVFVEIKKKVCGMVYKRRVMMKYSDAVGYLEYGLAAPKPCQITREIDYLKKFYGNLKPAMFVSYHRLSFVDRNDNRLRVTFDDKILCRETDLSLDKGIWGKPLTDDGVKLMEIKTVECMPPWLSAALDKCCIYPGSFSKYGTAYTDTLSENTKEKEKVKIKGEIHCA